MGVKLRMGMHNAITAERFKIIKAAIAGGMTDAQVMSRYEIKRTTLKYIKKSVTYYEYRLYTEVLPAARKVPQVIEPNSGVAFEDYRPSFFSRKPLTYKRGDDNGEVYLWAVIIGAIAIVGLICLAVIVGGNK